MANILLIFVDGLGLGAADPDSNPLVRFDPPFFRALFGRPLTLQAAPFISDTACLVAIDAALGVAGLPQSATGQTALFTGVNAPRAMGRHILGFPGPALAEIIAAHGVMKQLAGQGYSVTSANMYSPNYLDLVAQRKRRHSVTTLTILGAGQRLRCLADMAAGQAVYQDITNEMLPGFGVDSVPQVSPAEAGRRLAGLAASHRFTLFEYFQTDRQGHKRDWGEARRIVGVLDEFFAAVHQAAADNTLVVITSDHGNFEDFSTKTHTENPVPLIVWGPDCRRFAQRINDLTDVKAAILDYLKEGEVLD
ncbi:MAG: metalloenzyme [Negativicutes bacterium]|nr:metalloenzyme [Negativicutes bacterium]